jgi:hypothetical protein
MTLYANGAREMAKSKSRGKTKAPVSREKASTPKLTAILACDGVQRDSISGKHSLMGVFGQIGTFRNQPLQPFAIYAKLSGGTGKSRISFVAESPSGKTIPVVDEPQELTLAIGQIVEAVAVVGGIRLEESGPYKFRVLVNGSPVGEPCPVQIVLVDIPNVDPKKST